MHFLALDIGGANIKAADGVGYSATYPFPLWKDSAKLSRQLRTIISEAPQSDHLVVTMTGELADCFATKAIGVKFILDAVGKASDNRHARVYLSDGRMVTPQVALNFPQFVAAANWHVLATFAARFAPNRTALLIDIGSTTTDIIPIVNNVVTTRGSTDTTRLLSGELVYSGVERTAVCAVVQQVPYRGQKCPVAAEYFATTLDAYLVLERLPENPNNTNTADGKPATKGAARVRLGRVIAADEEEFNHRDAIVMAEAIANAQLARIAGAVKHVVSRLPQPPNVYILSGHGEFLALKGLEDFPPVSEVVRLSEKLGPEISRCAPAHALAVLAREAVGLG